MSGDGVEVRPGTAADEAFIRDSLTDAFGAPEVAGHDELIDAAALPAGVAWLAGERVGLLTHRPDGEGGWEIVSIVAVRSGHGVGGALLDWIRAEARSAGARRIWLVTTNDNTNALRFYQRHGFDLIRLDRDAVTRARKLKPAIPAQADGIPVRHELELELRLADAARGVAGRQPRAAK